jgi:hypothetical protein
MLIQNGDVNNESCVLTEMNDFLFNKRERNCDDQTFKTEFNRFYLDFGLN